MVQLTATARPATRTLNALFEPLTSVAARCATLLTADAGSFPSGKSRYALRRFVFSGPPAEHDRIRLGIFAGLHGDEPAGCGTVVKFLCDLATQPHLARGYDLFVYPVCNPTG